MGAVQRQRQQPPPLLAQRVLGDQRLEVADEQRSVAQLQPRLEAALPGHGAQLGQPDGLGLDPGLTGVLAVGGAPPQREGVVEGAYGVRGLQRRGAVDRLLEAAGVDRLGREPERVAGAGARDDPVPVPGHGFGLQAAAQVADVGLDRRRAVGRRMVSPDAVDEPLGRNDLAAHHHQRRKHGALAPPAEIDDGTVPRGRQLAEHAQAR